MPPNEDEMPTCVHHWRIDAARGRTSSGQCRYCGEIKAFDNRGPYLSYREQSKRTYAERHNIDSLASER